MRIAYVVTRADAVGGASIHVRDLARAMLERGHQAMVFLGGAGPVAEQLRSAGVPFHSLDFLRRSVNPWRDARAFRELASALRGWRADLVSAHTAKAGWIGRAVCARLGVPCVYTPHGLAAGSRVSPAAGPLIAFAERLAARWSAAIVCVCEAEKRLALSKRLAPPGKLHVVYNGVHDVAAELRASPGTTADAVPVRLCSVARMAAPKDHDTLLHALAGLRDDAWTLDLVGDGPREAELRDVAAALGIGERVRFLGYLPDPAPALAAAQVFVLSSRSEGFPRSLLEAMRAGLPCAASAVGGVPEAVSHGVSGLLVPPANPVALAGALRCLISSAGERIRMGAQARLVYEARFRFEFLIKNTMAVYGTVLKRAAA